MAEPVAPDGWTSGGPLAVAKLTAEYAEEPHGTDEVRPRLAWIATAPGYGATQSAYQVLVASQPELLSPEQADVWDSGQVGSDAVQVAYDGPALAARTRYHWAVRLWDGQGRAGRWSRPSWFETALLDEGFGAARWIGASTEAAPLLRRPFELTGPVRRARLYASGLAYAVLRVNGQQVGDAVLDPGFTNYDRTVLYVTHDVTELLQAGENVLGAELGRGFFGMTTPNVWRWHQAPWTGDPRLLARLVIDHEDGTTTELVSDGSWRVTSGPTVSDSLYAGERYDARLAQPGWDAPGFDDAAWSPAVELTAPQGTLRAQAHEPIRVVEEVAPVAISSPRAGVQVIDFGRTTAGWAKLRVEAPAGSRFTLVYGETLTADGQVEATNRHVDGDRFQQDEYVAAGHEIEQWEPRFSYKGFRYLQVTGDAEAEVVLKVVHSDVRAASRFDSDVEVYSWLEQAMRRTVLNNLHGIPTDTPIFEKNGWTGDAQVGAPTMASLVDLARFFTKWLDDLRDSQLPDGRLPVIVPSAGWGYAELAPATEWSTVYPFLLREMHRWYGDTRVLADHWDAVLRYLDWELERVEDGLSISVLGDWLPPGYPDGPPPEDSRLTATAYLHRAVTAVVEIGELIGETSELERLRKAAAELADGLNREFLDREAGLYRTAADPDYRQTSNAVPLAFGLVPEDQVPRVVANLVADVQARDFHLNTGCLGVGVLLPVLTQYGHADVAAKLAQQRTYPSWGYWLEEGADTLWEMWEADTRSRNHYFHGTVVQWLLESVAGLRNVGNGWQRIVVRPDARTGSTSAALRTDTVRGRVAASWRLVGRVLQLEVQVPVGCVAEVHVPSEAAADVTAVPSPYAGEPTRSDGYTVYTVPSGQWHFTSRTA
ncbi:alpha-L-rhamnosidase [Kribbella flavida DSM 17836]|uniref:alpha-L-rhamnosidase n=1 Tax=Kribbella flavida (strain DSM 17836 / JCM 10339 / NBRC 14399) TaxID=479435 RepID=D2PXQ4_KRIFD|nr:family 78 glycoside hydrolase catalytic domain [Kribbella flavida]ADB31696.1 alpha-L-rhamnosidase [Kribbella flavida DSM 17836]